MGGTPQPEPSPPTAAAAAAAPLRLNVAGYPLYVASFADDLSAEGHEVKTASSVWTCAVVLVKYLEYTAAAAAADATKPSSSRSRATLPRPLLGPSSVVLELGAGTGLVGVAAARLMASKAKAASQATAGAGASGEGGSGGGGGGSGSGSGSGSDASNRSGEVIITDVGSVVPGLLQTIAANNNAAPDGSLGSGESASASSTLHARAAALDWTRAEADLAEIRRRQPAPFDVILAADVVWVEHLILPFAHALAEAASADTLVYFAFQLRSLRGERLLFAALASHFRWEKLDDAEYHPDFRVPGKITIYVMKKKRAEAAAQELAKEAAKISAADEDGHTDL